MTRRPLAACALLAASIAAALPALADPASEASFFDRLARKSYSKHRYGKALESFLLADEAAPSPRSLYNIAVCAQLAGDDALAFSYFDAYLASPDSDGDRRSEAQRLAATLQQKLAVVRVESDPPGAAIVVDRPELGQFGRTPRSVVVSPGEHDVIVSLQDHLVAHQPVEAKTGEVATVRVSLRRLQGTLQTITTPPGALVQVWEPKLRISGTVDGGRMELPVGNYIVRASAHGYQAAESEVTIRAGAVARVTLAAQEIPAPVGALLVHSGSTPAYVLVDGSSKALTPARIEKLPAGRHAVELRAAGFMTWRANVDIEPDGTAYVNVTLRRLEEDRTR